MCSCPFVCDQDYCYCYTNIQPEGNLNLKENTCDYMYNYCQNYGDVEGEKWDVVDDESRGANGVADC